MTNSSLGGLLFFCQPDAPSIKTKPLRPDPEPLQFELDEALIIIILFTPKTQRKLSISLPFSLSDLSTLKSVHRNSPEAIGSG